ncbi:hypothetical protein SprV_0301067400 [Sparganum proliferum]
MTTSLMSITATSIILATTPKTTRTTTSPASATGKNTPGASFITTLTTTTTTTTTCNMDSISTPPPLRSHIQLMHRPGRSPENPSHCDRRTSSRNPDIHLPPPPPLSTQIHSPLDLFGYVCIYDSEIYRDIVTPNTLCTFNNSPISSISDSSSTIATPARNGITATDSAAVNLSCPHCHRARISRTGLVVHLRIHNAETREAAPGVLTYTRLPAPPVYSATEHSIIAWVCPTI